MRSEAGTSGQPARDAGTSGQPARDADTSGQPARDADTSGQLDLVVVGLGYVGLPLVAEATRAGLRVQGFDISAAVVDGLNAGRSHVDDLSDSDVAALLGAGFRATTDESALGRAHTVVICVPTPLGEDRGPDLGPVRAAITTIGRHLQPGQLVVLESTTWPGTTEEVVRPVLEQASGLSAGRDFFLAFSPERIDPGNRTWTLHNTPKVVGGLTPACRERAEAFYGQFVSEVILARGPREAEMAKLLENTYRHVNIALVNEMARFCHELDIDLWDVIRCAATKPFGFQAFRPGPGVGGHCIPIDPNYLGYRVRARLGYPFRFVELAEEINAGMPGYVARRIGDLLNQEHKPVRGSVILLLGVTYKPDIADQRSSPALPLAQLLRGQGAIVRFHDPMVAHWHVNGLTLDRVADLTAALSEADAVVLLQAHREYDVDALAEASAAFLDTSGTARSDAAERL